MSDPGGRRRLVALAALVAVAAVTTAAARGARPAPGSPGGRGAAAAGVPAAAPGPPAPPPRPLRVVSLNVFHGGIFSGWTGNDHDLDRRLQLAAEELRALDPDLVGLQEASAGPGRGNVAARLAEALGLHWVRGPVIDGVLAWLLRFSEGPAILSRYPIAAWEAHDLPRCQELWEPRVLIYAEVETPWGRLPVFSTHTSRGEECQTRRIADLVRERRGGRPAVLMGDFNATEDSASLLALTRGAGLVDAFRAANPDAPGPTVWQRVDWPEPTVRRRVDFVLVAPRDAADPAGRREAARWAGPGRDGRNLVRASRVVVNAPHRLPDGRVLWATDHYGVLAEVALFPDAGRGAAGEGDARQDEPASGPLAQRERLGGQ